MNLFSKLIVLIVPLFLSVDIVLVICCLNEWILILSVSVWFLFVVRPPVVVLTDMYMRSYEISHYYIVT